MRTDLSRRERQILEVIYRLGEASANEIAAQLPDDLANATVRTQLRIMEEKGAIKHRSEGRKFLYRAAGSKQSAAKSALKTVLDVFFGGSVEHALVTHLNDPKAKIDADEIQRLRELIDQYEAQSNKNDSNPTETRQSKRKTERRDS